MKKLDYYEFLQISPNADHETIHRVYLFLASRYHPDNPKSGSAEKFSLLKSAYDVLANPDRRARYDASRQKEPPPVVPLSSTIDFMDQIEGELNRRLALLAVLYFRRRANPYAPEVPLAEVERRMGFPRDYLDFTTWYLEKKGFITRADNSDFTLTANGVDFVETQRTQIPVLNRLLTSGTDAIGADSDEELRASGPNHDANHALAAEHPPVEYRVNATERRVNKKDRRVGAPDLRANPVERRFHAPERRSSAPDRRSRTTGRPPEN